MPRLLVIQHLPREGPGLFATVAAERGLEPNIFRLDQGDPLPELLKGDLLLVLGGHMGIRDIGASNYPWLSNELSLIKKALDDQISIIGVCLGAQLLAHASGGDVEVLMGPNHAPLPEVGWESIFFLEKGMDKFWSSFSEPPFDVLHWHGDRILLPSSAELIASSRRCREQFFKIGSMAYGLQFHVETDYKMVVKWIKEDEKFITTALGNNAKLILQEQHKLYGHKTLQRRLSFLRALFDEMGFCCS